MLNFFNNIQSMSPQDVANKLESPDSYFVDVRTKAEYNQGHASGAINIPLDTISSEAEVLKKYKTVYVTCRSGGRSAEVVLILQSRGVNAINVSGGTIAWASALLPME